MFRLIKFLIGLLVLVIIVLAVLWFLGMLPSEKIEEALPDNMPTPIADIMDIIISENPADQTTEPSPTPDLDEAQDTPSLE